MKLNRKQIFKYLFIALLAVIIANFIVKDKNDGLIIRDLPEIISSDEFRILTTYNSIGYFVEEDTTAGFQFELIHAILKDKNLNFTITPVMGIDEQVKLINEGKYDLLATNIAATTEFKEIIALTSPILKNKKVLVQRKDSLALKTTFISNQLELAKKKLHIIKNAPAILRIENLSNEIADTIYIEEVEKYGEEQLIALVAYGDIDYTVCDERIALKALERHPQLDASLAIGFTQFYSWGVNKNSTILLDSLNHWIEDFKLTDEYLSIYHKYYN